MESCTTTPVVAAFRMKGRFSRDVEGLCGAVPVGAAGCCVRILCRFFARMQIYCAGFCAALVGRAGDRIGVVVIGHLQIVLVSDWRGITKPLANNVQGKFVRQFRLPAPLGLSSGQHALPNGACENGYCCIDTA